jgi:hypothetical protein
MIFTSNHFVPSEIIQVPGVVGDSKMVKSRTLQEGTVEGDQPQWGGCVATVHCENWESLATPARRAKYGGAWLQAAEIHIHG